MASGLTSTGLVIEAIDDIRSGMQTDIRNTFFASLPVGDQDLLGFMVGIIANELGLLWERLEQVNSSQDPDKASAAALRALSALTGTLPQPATSSTVTETLCGDPATTVGAGFVIQTVSNQQNFDTQDTVVIAALAAWAPTSPYAVLDRVTNAARCYQCITAGISAGSGGPTTTASDITDGAAHWVYIGEGTGAIDVLAACEDTGPIQATAGDLTAIQTPLGGVKSARNLTDATLGANESTDEELRLIRQIELAGNGATTKDALRAEILKLAGVVSCTVFTNPADTTDVNGLPPHSFETLVLGGTVQNIVDTIADNMPAGVATYSSAGTSGTHTDSEGTATTIFYTRPTNVNSYIDITVQYDADHYPSDGDTEVKNAILTWGADFTTGKDINPSAVGAQAFQIDGVLGVPQVLVYNDVIGSSVAWVALTGYVNTPGGPSIVTNDGRVYVCITSGTSAGAGGPTGTATDITDGGVHWRYLGNILTITLRQLAIFDSTRITVRSSAITP